MAILSKAPRILFLYDFPLHGGGSGAYVKYLALRLHQAYHYTIGIAAPNNEIIDPEIANFALRLPQIPVFVGRPGLEGSKRYSELSNYEIEELYHAFLQGTMAAVESFQPDLIHVHHVMINAWVARFIRSLYGTKFIITSHGSCQHAVSQDRRYFRMSRDAARAANFITCVSGDSRARFLRTFGANLGSKTRTIPGGVRLSLFDTKRDIIAIKKQYGLEHGNIAIFTGRFTSEKGIEYLVKAAKSIHGTVVLVGDGPERIHIERFVKENACANVRILPYITHYPDYLDLLAVSDVFVSPSVCNEAFGLTNIEAMALYKPVVVTRKGGISTAVKDGVTGVFVRPRNSTEIANAVNILFADPALREKMGNKGHEAVENHFTWTKIAERFDKLYRDVYLYR